MPAGKANVLAKSLDIIAAKAPALRAAGVLAVDLGEVRFTLLPAPSGDPPAGPGGIDAPAGDPFQDPASYPGGVVPGYGPVTDDE